MPDNGQHITLVDLGWDDSYIEGPDVPPLEGRTVARVVAENRGVYIIRTADGELSGHVTGSFMYTSTGRTDYPAVGDWVLCTPYDGTDAVISAIVPRRTALVRRKSGDRTEAQVIAANIDTVFIVQGLDGDFNPRRLERYLVVAYESGAEPVIVLSKSDLPSPGELGGMTARAAASAGGAEVIAVSAVTGDGIDGLMRHIGRGRTVCFVGSSGAGKSTLINMLAGAELQRTAAVRENDSRGRHTTTSRRMLFLPDGGMLIDTPGMRELGLWDVTDSLGEAFGDIGRLADGCRFDDCTHMHEPGCAVREAVERGELPEEQYQSFLKLGREAEFVRAKTEERFRHERKNQEKRFHKMIRRSLREVDKRKGRT